MKYLVLLVVLVVAIGIWRHRRAPENTQAQAGQPSPPALPQDILACARCGVHIPRTEALMLGDQAYCCAEHQRLGPA